jgi:fermentation-respiration switch protein FrsA (DUF1100 family)
LPENTALPPPQRTVLDEAGGAVFSSEPGLEDAVWVEIPGNSGRTVGGYLSLENADSGDIVIVLHGASTFSTDGAVDGARGFHEGFGLAYRQAGYRTLSLDFQECGTAYGQGDTADVVQAIDWLNGPGKAVLGTTGIYLVGYSVGATAAIVANRQRQVTAVASISGITEPQSLQGAWFLYYLAGSLYPNNEGLCQVGSTLAVYGLPGWPGWDTLNTVARVNELQSPMLVIQGTSDQLFPVSNAQNLEAAYQQALSEGLTLSPVEFLYIPDADHFAVVGPEVADAILAFFGRFHRQAEGGRVQLAYAAR